VGWQFDVSRAGGRVKLDAPIAAGLSGVVRAEYGANARHLVPAVDADGNERSGFRTAEQAVPVATFTGWNFRNATVGGTSHLFALMGSSIPFPKTAADRQQAKDVRPSIAQRYPNRERYVEFAKAQCNKLVAALRFRFRNVTVRPVVSRQETGDKWSVVSGQCSGPWSMVHGPSSLRPWRADRGR
jgi:hypothetical protein